MKKGLFVQGFDPRRNKGGKPFIKVRQRLSKVMADELDNVAPVAVTKQLGMPDGSSFAQCICRCVVELAARGDISAARFIFECTEAAKVRIDVNERQEVAVHVVHEDARSVVEKLLGPNRENRIDENQSPILDLKPLPGKPS